MGAPRHVVFDRRITVEAVGSGPEGDARIAALRARVPPDRVEQFDERTLRYRRDAPLALGLACVALFTLALLGHVMIRHLPFARFVHVGLTAVLDLAAVACACALIAALGWRAELLAEGGRIAARERVAFMWQKPRWIDAEDATAVLVLPAPSRRVVLVGARNLELLELYRERLLDPPGLSDWMAEALALIASRAIASARG